MTIFGVRALLALRWPQIASGVKLGGLLEQILLPRWAKGDQSGAGLRINWPALYIFGDVGNRVSQISLYK